MKLVSLCLLGAWFFAGNALANDSFASEFSHFSGGMLVGGAAAAYADRRWPEDRLLVGFLVGASFGALGELAQKATGGSYSAIDVASNAAGAAIGAIITDKFILVPVVRRSSARLAFVLYW